MLSRQATNEPWPCFGEVAGSVRMTVDEVTRGGFYWYRDVKPSAQWELIDIAIHQNPAGRNIYFIRAMVTVEQDDYDLPGVFVGPLTPPAEG